MVVSKLIVTHFRGNTAHITINLLYTVQEA